MQNIIYLLTDKKKTTKILPPPKKKNQTLLLSCIFISQLKEKWGKLLTNFYSSNNMTTSVDKGRTTDVVCLDF